MELFSDVIFPFFQKRGSTREYVNTFYPELVELKDIRTKERKIRRYLSNQSIPPYQEAKTMLLNLGVTISEEELLVLLESTKSSINTKDFLGSRPNLLIESINITYSDIKDDLPDVQYGEIKMMIQDRINTTTKNHTSKEYLTKLIAKDLKEAVLDYYEEDKTEWKL